MKIKKVTHSFLLLTVSIFLFSCATSQKGVEFTTQNPNPQVFADIKKDVVTKAIETGRRFGYAPVAHDYDNGSVQLQKLVMGTKWNVMINCVVVGKKLTVNIYSPDSAGPVSGGGGHDVNKFHQEIMKLYQ